MKPVVTVLTFVLLACGSSYGEEDPADVSEHLKTYRPFIGTWRYEGPLLEDVSGIAEKGSKTVFQFSWKWILNKSVIEEEWSIEFEDGTEIAAKGLIGWNAAEGKATFGSMNSLGGMTMGTSVFDADTTSRTYTSKGIDGEGNETSAKGVIAKTDKDTLTWKALECHFAPETVPAVCASNGTTFPPFLPSFRFGTV